MCYPRLAESADGTWGVDEEFFPKYLARAAWEKNWDFFEHHGELLAVYSIKPHHILCIEGNKAELIAESQCDFRKKPGLLHGDAPPAFHRGEYYCFYHRRLGTSWGQVVQH